MYDEMIAAKFTIDMEEWGWEWLGFRITTLHKVSGPAVWQHWSVMLGPIEISNHFKRIDKK